MERRAFLKGGGVVSILLAGGTVWRASEQGVFSAGEGRAYEPGKIGEAIPGRVLLHWCVPPSWRPVLTIPSRGFSA